MRGKNFDSIPLSARHEGKGEAEALRLNREWLCGRLAFCLLGALTACALTSACGRTATDESAQGDAARVTEAREIVVAAASNLTEAFDELGHAFTSQTRVRVVYSFGATADLARQIEQGAPFDAFAAADTETLERLESKGLLTEATRAVYARGRLVLWLPNDARAGAQVRRIEDLTRADVERIALAKPDIAPYGRAAVEALRALEIWEAVEPKVVYGQNVSQAKQFAATGNADAAFIPRSLVRAEEGRAIDVAEDLHQPIKQSIAVVRASGRQEAARRFVEFVRSPAGQTLLERYGYGKADAK